MSMPQRTVEETLCGYVIILYLHVTILFDGEFGFSVNEPSGSKTIAFRSPNSVLHEVEEHVKRSLEVTERPQRAITWRIQVT